MELLYIWIENYKNIHRQGFNFSPKHHFEFIPEFDDNNNITGGELKHTEKNYNLPDNFFGDNIVNITGIVGKNGSGKSSVLDFVKKLIKNYNFKKIVIFKQNEEITIFHNENFNFNASEYFKKYILSNGDNLFCCLNIVSVYFSNTFSPFSYYNPKSIYSFSEDISLNYTLKKIENKTKEKDNNISVFQNYWYDNLKIINKFIDKTEYSEKILQLIGKENGIKEITIIVNSYDLIPYSFTLSFKIFYNFFKHNKYDQFLLRFFQIILTLIIDNSLKKILETINDEKEKDLIKSDFHETYKILNDINSGSFLNKYDDYLNDKKPLIDCLDFLKDIYNTLNKEYDTNKFIEKFNKILSDHNFKDFKDLLDNILSIKIKDITYNDLSDNFISFNIPRKYLIELVNKYENTLHENINDYLGFDWGLSSGELAFINLFSRLLEVKEKIINDTKRKNIIFKTYLILLDEIDLYLHPEWSKQNIYLLKEVLPLIFDKPVQLIITAHSPFIVSDLPKEHIIFLDRDEYGHCKVIPEIEQKETFGANIHTLFSNAFFMQDGLIGEFAEEKIQNVIDYLNNNKRDSKIKNNEEAQAIINIIGEPIIKNQLQKMLNNKRLEKNDDIDALKKQMRYLKSKISKLENKK